MQEQLLVTYFNMLIFLMKYIPVFHPVGATMYPKFAPGKFVVQKCLVLKQNINTLNITFVSE
ncbi:MAG: hypothetical protein COA83_05395 [Methylophaga sp.]|nr:MAG: hypothetical protein COA83_05395 [Methylophaga sp.]